MRGGSACSSGGTYPAEMWPASPLPPPLPRDAPAWMSRPTEQERLAFVESVKGSYVLEVSTIGYGWPRRAICCERWVFSYWPPGVPQAKTTEVFGSDYRAGLRVGRGSGGGDVVLPLRPIWSGMLTDIVFWSLASAALFWAIQRMQTAKRSRRGLCTACGYSRSGLAGTAPCPECGQLATENARTLGSG